MTFKALSEASRLTVPWLLALNAVAGAFAGGSAAATWYYTTRESERAWVRQEIKAHAQDAEQRERLIFLTREEAAKHREADREKLELKLDGLRQDVQRLALAVERLGRR